MTPVNNISRDTMTPRDSAKGLPPLDVRGIDVSSLAEVEACGGRFCHDGQESDLLEIAAGNGVNLVRLRLWVNPYDAAGQGYLGGGNDLETDLALARRATSHGMQIMVDLHYSDFWTDPRKQVLPREWTGQDLSELALTVNRYTADVLGAFLRVGVVPSRVQVGNEITNGMLWPLGQLPRHDDRAHVRPGATRHQEAAAFDALALLVRAGTTAVRRTTPDARVCVHLDDGGDTALYQHWLDQMLQRGLDVDEVGLSYYPYWHGSLDDLSTTMGHIAGRYGLDVVVLETAYGASTRSHGPATVLNEELVQAGGYPATPEGQLRYLTDLRDRVASVPGGHGRGLVYWEPAWLAVPGTSWASQAGMRYGDDVAPAGPSWANQALFDDNGQALPAWQVFRP